MREVRLPGEGFCPGRRQMGRGAHILVAADIQAPYGKLRAVPLYGQANDLAGDDFFHDEIFRLTPQINRVGLSVTMMSDAICTFLPQKIMSGAANTALKLPMSVSVR